MELETTEAIFRLTTFAALLAVLLLLEMILPRTKGRLSRLIRWPANFGVGFLGLLLGRLLAPVSAIGVATLAADNDFGLLNVLQLPPALALPAAVIALDGIIYLQHRAMHIFPVLWRLHRMHHTDVDIDVSTALRFHPFEIALSLAIKLAAVSLLGAPALAVLVFEITLNGCAMFNHANLRIPIWMDRVLRVAIVTPDMHRVHHSVREQERITNFGFCLSVWDRWLGTYTSQPSNGVENITTGLPGYDAIDSARIDRMLTNPLLKN